VIHELKSKSNLGLYLD
jgi:hypothetical protein